MRKLTYILAILLCAAVIPSQAQEKKKITLEDIWKSGTFFPKGIQGFRSMKDGKHYSKVRQNEDGSKDLMKYAYANGKEVAVIFTGSDIKDAEGEILNWSDYELSNDESKVVFSTESEAIYRHSSKANYYIYDINTKKTKAVDSRGKQMYATLSSDNSKVAFVRDNNLYVKDLSSGTVTAITTDGRQNHIINGATDWVYEEEFSFDRAYQWSPDGKYIAYYRFDESEVKEYNLAMYGSLYPEDYKFKYPKAGEDNSVVRIYIFELATEKTVMAKVDGPEDQYIPRIKWTRDPNVLCIFRMNRLQNKLELLKCNAQSGECTVMFSEENDTFIEITDDIHFLKNGKQFVWTSRKDGYNHIYLYDMQGKLVKQVTKGEWDVLALYGYDEDSKTFYYQSAESSPLVKEVYAVKLDGKKSSIGPAGGSGSAKFSNTYDYFLSTHSSIQSPPVYSMRNAKGKELYVMEDNAELLETIREKGIIEKEFFDFKNSEGILLNGWMIRPPDFDPTNKYPVLMFVYGGPGSQTVTKSWNGHNDYWHNLLANEGYIIVSVDNRGTGARGADFYDCTYKELGKYETIDQIEAARYLSSRPYVDKDRIGIWGWSYGGFMTLSCLTKGDGLFKAGIAVAPVTNWRYYDTIYTERYMRTPQENPGGYDDNSPINFVDDFQGNLLLVHGMADDNVHFQNSVEFVTAMVEADKQFELFMYPNKNHGIYGGNTRYHLFSKMTDFILENL